MRIIIMMAVDDDDTRDIEHNYAPSHLFNRPVSHHPHPRGDANDVSVSLLLLPHHLPSVDDDNNNIARVVTSQTPLLPSPSTAAPGTSSL